MKAWDLPITHNALKTRDDLALALAQILEPLEGRLVRGGSGLHAGNGSALYSDQVALLEGFSRLLWGLSPLAAGGGSSPMIAPMLKGLAAGVDPESPYFWGVGGNKDQRYVEMAAFALALIIAPETFWEPLGEAGRSRLASWLGTINSVELPPNNWEFFRALVNVALRRRGMPYDEGRLEKGLQFIDALYRSDGWYLDDTNYDFYNPFALHFYGLVYAAVAGGEDPERAARFRERSRLFAREYLPWFGSDGSIVPYGRSLSYRFAVSSFFSACAFAGEEVVSWGALKGLVLRNLRWWFAQPIFDHEGVLTVGYRYPDLIMAEQYNSPGSPYWSLKTFLVLALPPTHPFWLAEEEELPEQPAVSRNAPPDMLLCRSGRGESEQVYALAAGQSLCWIEHAAAKYSKFAYSNRFGFCVSHGSFDLPKTGCDSMLLFSEGDGYWRERRDARERSSEGGYVASTWSPWPDVEVRTYLLPFGEWHVRVHAIRSERALESVEGGFSLPDEDGFEAARDPRACAAEGSILASFPWAWGGILDLLPAPGGPRLAELHRPDPNLNIQYPRVYVPILRGRVGTGLTVIACAVCAGLGRGAEEAWASPPRLDLDARAGIAVARRGEKIVEIRLPAAGGPRAV
jgi:hypothetical protein